MPKTPSTGWYHQPFLWRAAEAKMLVVCRCRSCRRSVTYFAADLVPLFHRDAVIGALWGTCPRCGGSECWAEQERHANSDDVANTVLRRPAGFRKVQLWREEFYEPSPAPAAEDRYARIWQDPWNRRRG